MEWLSNLFTATDSVGHIILLYALVISVGLYLGRLKVAGISLGVTFVLFAGITLVMAAVSLWGVTGRYSF
jgi:putative transport protein